MSKCPNPHKCGSCTWSHIPYKVQLEKKLAQIPNCSKIIPSPRSDHYRNRMDFVINYQGYVGLREKGKWWSTLDNHCCFIADPLIEQAFYKIRLWVQNSGLSFFDRRKYTGLLRYAVIRATTVGQCMVTIVTSAPSEADSEAVILEKLTKLAASIKPTTLIWSINDTKSDVSFGEHVRVITGKGFIEETIGDITFQIRPNSFFQTNSWGAAELLRVVLDFAERVTPAKIVDLYCGGGFFTLALKKKFENATVLGIELVEAAIQDAKTNAIANNLDVKFEVSRVEDLDPKVINSDLVLVDPPRAGLHPKVVESIRKIRPKHILYVSCSYTSFERDFELLKKFYEIKECIAVDMFPHTPHVEVVSFLKLA